MASRNADLTVAIIGGGIGGLSTGVALQHLGFNAHVYEAAGELAPAGKGIWVPTNAMQIMDRLGLGAGIAALGVPLESAEVRDVRSGTIQGIDMSAIRERYGRTTVSIRRTELQTVLAEALLPGTLHLGKRCVRADQTGPSASAEFGDGSSVSCGLLVGADGIHATTRLAVAGDVHPRFAGQTCYLGLSNMNLPPDLSRSSWEIWGGGVRFGFSPVAEAQVYWFAPATSLPNSPEPPDILAALVDRYASFPSPIPAILAHTPLDEIICVDLYDLPPLDVWHRGRIVLVGDAAHATTPNLGQGGAQAVEDAWALAHALADQATIEAALVAYEGARRAKAQRVVTLSRWMGRLAHLEASWARACRNFVLRALPQSLTLNQLDWLYSTS